MRRVKGSHLDHVCTGGTENNFGKALGTKHKTGHTDPDGYESIEAYECVEGCPVLEMDRQSGVSKSGKPQTHKGGLGQNFMDDGWQPPAEYTTKEHGDQGGASRFFPRFDAPFLYQAKASRAERNRGLEGMPEEKNDWQRETSGMNQDRPGREGRKPMSGAANHHPTVKPLALMDWLVRLITPPGGVVLDPFMGSGSTGCSAARLGFDFIGIEREPEYLEIARRRIEHWSLPEAERPTPKNVPNGTAGCYGTETVEGAARRGPGVAASDHDEPPTLQDVLPLELG